MFELLEFDIGHTETYFVHDPEAGGGPQLLPQDIDRTSSEGRRIRAKLLRAWLEISAWRNIYKQSGEWVQDSVTDFQLSVKYRW